MNIGAVMDELAARAATAPALAAGGGATGTPGVRGTPPFAVANYPENTEYDQTGARGVDRITGSVVVFVGRPDEPQTRDALSELADGDGPGSLKALLEDDGDYTSCDTVSILRSSNDVYEYAGVPCLVAVFEYEIYGPGKGA